MSKFDVKDRLDALMYSAYNFVSDIIFGLDIKSNNLVRRNVVFKNIHDGERCFILGTGPSLRALTEGQVNKLKTEVLFGVNSLYKSGAVSVLEPKYYTLIDNLYWEGWSGTFAEVVNRYKNNPPVFITDPRAKNIIDGLCLDRPSIYVYSKKYPTVEMSADISDNVYAAMNCISYSILVAMYMGFKEVYILGCDYNAFCSAGVGHCYDDKEELKGTSYNLAFYLKFYWITTEFHYLIAKLAKKMGVKLINLTPNSLLDAYPRKLVGEIL